MTKTIWVRPLGRAPSPGPRSVSGYSRTSAGDRFTVWAVREVYDGGRVLMKLTDTRAGREAAALLSEEMIDAVF